MIPEAIYNFWEILGEGTHTCIIIVNLQHPLLAKETIKQNAIQLMNQT